MPEVGGGVRKEEIECTEVIKPDNFFQSKMKTLLRSIKEEENKDLCSFQNSKKHPVFFKFIKIKYILPRVHFLIKQNVVC